MTRKEAIQILSTRDAHGVLCGYTGGVTEALDMAIEALQFVEHFDLLKEYQSLQEVVWCKDCRLAQDDITHLYCDYFGHKTYEDDFCSYGERKGGDGE